MAAVVRVFPAPSSREESNRLLTRLITSSVASGRRAAPLFTLAQLPMTPMRLVRKWRELLASDDPFIELYRSTLFQSDLPPRARYLQLIQALEAHHGYANRGADELTQAKFGTRRQQIIDATQEVGLARQGVSLPQGRVEQEKTRLFRTPAPCSSARTSQEGVTPGSGVRPSTRSDSVTTHG